MSAQASIHRLPASKSLLLQLLLSHLLEAILLRLLERLFLISMVLLSRPRTPFRDGAKAFLDISSLSPGSHTVKANYLGDGNYQASSSGSITQAVEPVGSAILYFLGDSQSTPVNTLFLNSLMFDIININPKLVGGASVTFTAPSGGASGTFSNGTNSITIKTTPIGSVGVANSGSFTANGIGGTYTVTATIPGFGTATFTMTNIAPCDPEALAFTGSYADVNLGCNPANPDGSLGTATATDVCGAVTITSI